MTNSMVQLITILLPATSWRKCLSSKVRSSKNSNQDGGRGTNSSTSIPPVDMLPIIYWTQIWNFRCILYLFLLFSSDAGGINCKLRIVIYDSPSSCSHSRDVAFRTSQTYSWVNFIKINMKYTDFSVLHVLFVDI